MKDTGSIRGAMPGTWMMGLAALLLVSACAHELEAQIAAEATDAAYIAQPQLAAEAIDEAYVAELTAAAETIEVQPADEEIVCRKEMQVGTHFTRERCFTRRRLEEITRNAQDWLRSGGSDGAPTAVR